MCGALYHLEHCDFWLAKCRGEVRVSHDLALIGRVLQVVQFDAFPYLFRAWDRVVLAVPMMHASGAVIRHKGCMRDVMGWQERKLTSFLPHLNE